MWCIRCGLSRFISKTNALYSSVSRYSYFHCQRAPSLSVSVDDNVWKEVLEMDDKVKVRYDVIEELFCQKTATAAKAQEQPKKAKVPTEVDRTART